MLKRLWQWLKKLLRRLLGSQQIPVSSPVREMRRVEAPQLTDAEYESIFLRLLAGVNDEGWSREQVQGFLDANCINEAALVGWLRGFGERLLASPTANDELARRMVQLAVLNVGEVGDVAGEIGRRLQEGREMNHRDTEDTEEREMGEAEAWFNQGVALANLGLYEQAIASYDKAIEIKHDFHDAWQNRGVALRQLGRYEEANTSFNTAFTQALQFTIKSDDYEAWYYQGFTLSNLGEYEQAIASFDKAIEIQPDFYPAWNNRGLALYHLGQYEKAIASYDKALKIQPHFYQAWDNRGIAQANLGQYEQAITFFDKALEIQPDHYPGWNNRGNALEKLGQYEQAIASYDKALQIQPHFYQAWHNRGIAQANLGQYEQAIKSYDKALEIQPDFYQAWNNRGIAQANLGQYEQAIKSYDKALEIQPDFYQAWDNRGIALYYLGQYEQAIASYDKALEIQPDFYQVWYSRGNALAHIGEYEQAIASYDNALKIQLDFHPAWNNRGLSLAHIGEYEQAITSYDKALELKPDFSHAWNGRGAILCDHLQCYEEAIASFDKALEIQPDDYQVWHNRGNALGKLGQHEEAIASYDKAIKIEHNYPEAWTNRGVCLAKLKLYKEALESFDRALVINPNFLEVFNAWNGRGDVLRILGKYEQAIASYDKALKIQPDDYQAWHYRGNALVNLGKYEQAIASYDKALEIQPDDYQVWHYRGIAQANLGQYEQAIVSYGKALQIQPDDYQAWNNRGNALYHLGQYEQVIVSYDKALEIQPDDYQAWLYRGNALYHLGQYEQAIASYDKALEIQPGDYQVWHYRGIAQANLGQYEQAIASYDKALQIQPDDYQTWYSRGITAGYSAECNELLALSSSISRQNPDLDQRGYEGCLASYEEGLKYCQQEKHPEGWGMLHRAIGNAHYLRGKGDFRLRSDWYKAVISYNEAIKTLTALDFPELHLDVLQDLIRVHSDLRETTEAAELQRQATDILRRLLDEPNRSDRSKKQLALKFAWLRQLTVDLAVQSGELLQAVELAEEGKNACLSWLLDGWSDEISSPSYSQMRQLLNPTTAIIYWHLSSYALHTFILKHDTPEPILFKESQLIEENGVIRQAQRLRDFEDWLKNWNQQYTDNRQGKKDEEAGTWRDNLPQMLSRLADILNINAIVEEIPDIQQLILIPHRDLHRLPIHAIFPPQYTISYLPCAQIGISLQQSQPTNLKSIPESSLLSVEHPESIGYPSLEFAQIESLVISQMFPHPHRIGSEEVTKPALLNALPQRYNIFHFTGHGEYNYHNPALSFLALAGEDRLTLADIRNFDLTSYQLVSLAACETAITGNHTITTEYVGLVSGFMGCGVAHVLSTLWIVESEASAVVMIRFYQLLQQGKSAVVALAETTQWLRNLTNAELAEWYAAEINNLPEEETLVREVWTENLDIIKNQQEANNQPYNHPYFWAAFTITGNFPLCNQ